MSSSGHVGVRDEGTGRERAKHGPILEEGWMGGPTKGKRGRAEGRVLEYRD